ncbi:hypothetical protein PGB90_008428 [Kerria lacca]
MLILVTRHMHKSLGLNQSYGICRKIYFSDNSSSKSKPKQSEPSVLGLSSQVVNVPSAETGPGALKTGKYKNPEYYCYHPTSYFDAEIEMAKFRLPQPSSRIN